MTPREQRLIDAGYTRYEKKPKSKKETPQSVDLLTDDLYQWQNEKLADMMSKGWEVLGRIQCKTAFLRGLETIAVAKGDFFLYILPDGSISDTCDDL